MSPHYFKAALISLFLLLLAFPMPSAARKEPNLPARDAMFFQPRPAPMTGIDCSQTVPGNITSPGQRDSYNFNGNAGDKVIISAYASGALCARAELRDPSGALIGHNGCDARTNVLSLPSTGPYTIFVSDFGLTSTGSYGLNLQFVTGSCGSPLVCSQTVSGTIGSVAESDAYTFTGNAGDKVVISAYASGALCARAEVYDPSGTLLGHNGCDASTNVLTLPTTGTYTILVSDFGLASTGAYGLSLQFTNARCGAPIACSQTISGEINASAQRFAYTFCGVAGSSVILSAIAPGALCARAELYDPSGMLLGNNGCDASTNALTLPTNGTYTVLVSDFGLASTGNFNLNLSCIGNICPLLFSTSGRVTTSSGAGISGVAMTFTRVSGTGTVPTSVLTDTNGNWTQTGFQPGTNYRVTPSKSGCTFNPISSDFSADNTALNFIGDCPTPCPTAQIEIIPSNPTTNDSVSIGLSGQWPDACIPQNPQVTVSGGEIRINTSNQSLFCAQVITFWSLTVPVGKLEARTYEVIVSHTSPGKQCELGRKSLVVTSPPSCGGTGQNIVTNGDFETPNAGSSWIVYSAGQTFGNWTVESGTVEHYGPVWKAANGSQSVDVTGVSAGALYQDLSTSPGQTYLLRFAMAGNPGGGPAIKQMEVWWGATKLDTLSFDVTGHSDNNMGWVYHQYSVVATANATRLRFKSLIDGVWGPTLDDVSVTQPVGGGSAVIIDGTDANEHGDNLGTGGANRNGWLYMQKALEELARQVPTGTAKVVVDLGTTDGTKARMAINSAFDKSSLPASGWTLTHIDGATTVGNWLAALSTSNTGILYLPTYNLTSGDLDLNEMAAINLHATEIANFVNGPANSPRGGALFAMGESNTSTNTGAWEWLKKLFPGIVISDVGTGGISTNIVLTPDGKTAFPGLTDADLAGADPWHNYFTGDFTPLKVLATAPDGNGATRNIILGGTCISIPRADLAVTKTDSPDPVTAGNNLTYTITVINKGPDVATGATLIDTLPTSVNFVSATPSQGSCSYVSGIVSGIVTCNLGNLTASASGNLATVTILVKPVTPGAITNQVSVSSNTSDPNPNDNTATQNTTVTSPTVCLDLIQLLPVTANVSSSYSGWPPGRAIDRNLNTSWFTNFGDAANRGTSPFYEVVFPQDVTVCRISMRGNREFATGYDFLSGRFDVFDAAGKVIFTSGAVNLPAPDRDIDLDVNPCVSGGRRVRFTGLSDEGPDPGFAELIVCGFPSSCPMVSSMSPASGPIGTPVTITGTNFQGVNAVIFTGCTEHNFGLTADGTRITTTVPPCAKTGPITIRKPGCADAQTPVFTVTGNCIPVSIPDSLTGSAGSSLTTPIMVGDLTGQGVVSYDFTLTYDPAVLRFQMVDSSGTISSGMTITVNPGSGQIKVSAFGTQPLSSAGTLLKLKFDLIGKPGDCGDLKWVSFKFNEGTPCAARSDGRVCLVPNFSISGMVSYCASAQPIPVPGVTLKAAGTPPGSAVTDRDGKYQLTGLGNGAYTVTPEKTGDVNGISSFDASLVAQHVAGLIVLGPCKGTAADASGNGSITSFDASLIAQFAAGINSPNSLVGTWKFAPPSTPYPTLNGNLTDQNYAAILVGEVSGNWAPPASNAPLLNTAVQQESRGEPISISLPPASGEPGSSVIIPITVGHLTSLGVTAYDFEIVFDPSVLQLQDPPIDVDSTLSSIMTVTPYTPTPGHLRVSAFGTTALSGFGTLLNLKFKVIGAHVPSIPLRWESFTFNEGEPQASPANGRLSVNFLSKTSAVRAATIVSAASYTETALASEAMATTFGARLATATQAAETFPLPTALAGTRIVVRDSRGVERLAPLFFVSPMQINYQIPPETASGFATVTIMSGDGAVSIGTVEIAPVAPGLFTANADGTGITSALALRVKADGQAVYEPVAQLDSAQNKFVPLGLAFGAKNEQVFLLLYGTGIRGRSDLSNVKVEIGGREAQVLFAGAQGDFAGLDQINLLVPQDLIGRGEVDVVLTVDGKIANRVKLSIR